MVKKVDEDWMNFNISLSAQSNVRKYIDLCQSWLISPQSKHDTTSHRYFTIPPIFDENMMTDIGMFENDARNASEFTCFICKKPSNMQKDGKSIIANPFTRAQLMLLCNDCNHKISSYR